MKKTLIAGAVGLLMTSGVAFADSYSSTVTTQASPVDPSVVSTTRVDKSTTSEDGLLTQRTNIYHSAAPVVVQPTAQSTTTIERTTTTSSPNAE